VVGLLLGIQLEQFANDDEQQILMKEEVIIVNG
jgi:hypothetical protein